MAHGWMGRGGMSDLIIEFRLVLCGMLMRLILCLAPKNNAEGMRIVEAINDWALREIQLRRIHEPNV